MNAQSRSRRIYAELVGGRVINRSEYREGRESENPLYAELRDRREHYQRVYNELGFELVQGEGFFFLREADVVEPFRDATVRAVALLTVLGELTMMHSYRFALLTSEGGGFSAELCESAAENEEIKDILAAVGIKGDLWQELKNSLVDRRIAYLNDAGRLVLAEAGRHFFATLFELEPLGETATVFSANRDK